MSATGLAATYLARRAAQKERVRILYRRALKDALNWAVHRHIFYESAQELRDKFEANRYVEDLDTIDRMVDDAEATFNKMQHPDPYIVPWAPGGSKFTRNPAPTPGLHNLSMLLPLRLLPLPHYYKSYYDHNYCLCFSLDKSDEVPVGHWVSGKWWDLKIEIVYDYGLEEKQEL
ncbi:NADH dehydrogenase [ubiquinone] 1 beta subcomplex subunit 9 isoform X1 [Amborella trichopoda]|uniref:NADH dehydrogenase [ubiquinone] 1 beta subcomplex subunit 9 isoform X1 n=1 Tax=Amborella trichopoda TaxID=13333 RepID=UPI0005D381DA|nr:NADH dehydrogenase [ubiquinone] 1 beta subcomplex subunit 9 isoform X1 [Amborella trichopoda]|eukprot:XP_011627230.1 NADH dehydrogenase [ubiquinone] 1 beta subcomplex subunit 9 isoform X1 [Amborella trichopoda]